MRSLFQKESGSIKLIKQMANKSQIPDRLIEDILAKSADTWPAAKIATWLGTEHNVHVSSVAVSRQLKRVKEERKQIAQGVYAKAVAKSANRDLKILEDLKGKLYQASLKAFKQGKINEGKQLALASLQFVSKSLELSGINTPDQSSPEEERESIDQLLEKIGTIKSKRKDTAIVVESSKEPAEIQTFPKVELPVFPASN